MIVVLAALLACQLTGEIAARGLGVPVPGPVLGMVLLLGILALRARLARLVPAPLRDGTLEATAGGLLSHLSLLFVPAGVGVIQRLDVLGRHGLALLIALVVSSILGMLAAAFAFRFVARRREPRA